MEHANKKVAPKYECKKCPYITSKKSSWQKHIETKKHKKQLLLSENVAQNNICRHCNKSFSHTSSAIRHQKQCLEKLKNNKQKQTKSILKPEETINNDLEDMKKMMKTMMEQQEETKNQLNKLNESGPRTTNNMTINVYLNQYCKNAMNISDFIEQLQLSMEDLFYTKDNGYVKGISNIFLKNLQDLKPNERPIHCSDKKRLQFYVKDENKWAKDKNNQLDKSIVAIRHKQIQKIKEWEKEHPNWNTNDAETELYAKMVKEVIGNDESNDIKKEISEKVEIKDIKLTNDVPEQSLPENTKLTSIEI